MRAHVLAVLVAVLACHHPAAAGGPGAQQEETRETRATMGEIFEAMRFLLPLSLDAERFEDPALRGRVGEALARLERGASRLAEHAQSGEPAFLHLARMLSADARDVRERHAQGYVRETRQLVQIMAETCIACHSRLPAAQDAPGSEAFLRDAAVEGLSLPGRAKLAYATRQFDDAMALYEALLAAPPPSATWLDHEGYLDDYLELSIRVRRERERPAATLARLAARPDLSPALAEQLESWRRSLESLRAGTTRIDTVADVQTLVERSAGAADRRVWLVESLQASGLLHTRLEQAMPAAERARHYYLLGVLEARIGRTFWLSQAESFLETAIRLAPGSAVAAEAYALLEEVLVAGYGSQEAELPPDMQLRLDALREIAAGRAPGAASPR